CARSAMMDLAVPARRELQLSFGRRRDLARELALRRVGDERLGEQEDDRGDQERVIDVGVDGLDALGELALHLALELLGDLIDARRSALGAHELAARRRRRDLEKLLLAFDGELRHERAAATI